MSEAKNDFKHIAVLAFPFATHAAPLFSLIRRLSTMAPQAKFTFFSTKESNNKVFSGQARLENIKPYNVNDGLPEDYMISFENPHEPVGYFLKAAPGNFKQAMEVAVQVIGREITCIISDAFFWFGADIARELHVPWVPLWTAGPRPLLLHLETDLVRQKMGGDGVPEDRTIDFLPGFSEIRAADIPKELLYEDAIPEIPAMLYKMGQMLPRAAAVVSSSWEKLDPDVANQLRSRLHNFLEVGETMTKDGVTKAIKLILSTGEGEQMRKNVEHLQDLALDAVSNGSSSKNLETLLEVVTK
ncbi:ANTHOCYANIDIN 3-O-GLUCOSYLTRANSFERASE [Salix viminalis]|uniref:ANTHOCYANIDIN 3-O-GLUCOSYLTRANSFERASE n=1 Tax=Salix viminalis TaxID=40686 RepID=A0A9Q0SE01_SALVM|nr:ANTHOCYANIDIN 3-O-GLUCOSYLTRANSFERASE [Salix viminalis]